MADPAPESVWKIVQAIALCGMAVACSPAAPALQGSVLRAQLNADLVSSDPGMKRDLNTDAVLLHVVEGLVAYRENGSVGPMLARSWTVSHDGRTYRFALRPEVRFHNGAPLTGDDVLWSFRRYLAEGSSWRCKSDFGERGIARIVAMSAPDPHSFELTLDRPAPLLLATLARTDCGGTGITHRASLAADGSWRQPIGTGPFRWVGWRRNQYVDLARYAGYRSLPGGPDGNGGGKRALVDRLRFSVIPDASSASAALLRGSLDVLDGVSTSEVAVLRGVRGIRVVSSPSMDFYAVLLQSRDPLLADPRLRRAIALSLDVAGLTRIATRGTGLASSSPVARVSPYSGPVEQRLIARNLAASRALAAAAGYRGQPIELLASHSPPEMFDAALIVAAMAREAGINIRIVPLDWASQLARYTVGDYQATVFGYSARLDPALMYNAFVGDRTTDKRKVWGTPSALGLLHQAQATADPVARQRVFDAMEIAFHRETPAIILYNSRRLTALGADVRGFRPWPAQLPRFWNVAVERR